ncbi:6-bladed beta-propeller [Gemmatimonadota bacterium]
MDNRMQVNVSVTSIALISLVVVGLLATCSSGEKTIKHSFETFSDESGTVHSVSSGGPRHSSLIFSFKLVTILIEDPEHEESMLYRPTTIHMDEDGWIYVADSGNRRIAVFDREGRYHHSFGRAGQGPGEFTSMSLQHVTGDSATIFDPMNSRTTVYRRDGTLLSVISQAFFFRIGVNEIHTHPDGRNILIGQPLTGLSSSSPSTASCKKLRATIISPDGDTLAVVDTPKVPYGRSFVLEEYSRVGYGPIHYMGQPVLLYSPDHGLIMSTGMEPVVTWYGLDGTVDRVFTIEQERTEVTSEERTVLMKMSREAIENAGNEVRRAVAQRSHELMEIPNTKDHWTRVQLDDSDFLWLKHLPDYTADKASQDLSWMVISPEGEYLGDAEWPLQNGTLSQGHLLGFVTDEETGEMTGMVFRLVPVVRALEYP